MLELLNIHFSFCVAKVKLMTKVYHQLTVAAGSIFFALAL